ncbi:MAG: 6-pyruvoyl-tetrahydropterin synthase [Candidatus Methanohalarchaeum thermophilum]|uniref:6-pyruvoyl-tetrahydropterin synthase n=1 Tax=Methanohalarchaeum thermophilum TaxID=1903181 RepID=A0A1Q6DVG7_METT1|nr:MAG: 6-pyruvoyl-tetrahydropterin synthase [Candidatus Methanohalarchaeum thermophilum]
MNINVLKDYLNEIIEKYRDQILNQKQVFSKKQPSVENFSMEIWKEIYSKKLPNRIQELEVKVKEDSKSYASFHKEV